MCHSHFYCKNPYLQKAKTNILYWDTLRDTCPQCHIIYWKVVGCRNSIMSVLHFIFIVKKKNDEIPLLFHFLSLTYFHYSFVQIVCKYILLAATHFTWNYCVRQFTTQIKVICEIIFVQELCFTFIMQNF